ncbi:papain family cysteine protease domain-containing protein [Ditylenchus destructor]|uniref:Papain family cysteine protease domain-containing protein n=1 Tax=Ditylenchus destructor TaxID=166010 RepID=A0AAD4MKY1_9BILA|nr:papain family cysteine protease domain-containing protein [Ditylenchus destructor]
MWLVFAVAIFWCMLQSADAFYLYCAGQNAELRKLGIEILDRYDWEYDPEYPPFPAISYATDAKNIIHHTFYLTTLAVGYSIIIWCQSRIMQFFNKHGQSSHASTQRMHAEINRAMIALAITPTISLIMPVFIVVLALATSATLGPMAAFLSMCMSAITLANPLTVIYFVKPYRRAVIAFFTLGAYLGNASVGSSQTSGGQTPKTQQSLEATPAQKDGERTFAVIAESLKILGEATFGERMVPPISSGDMSSSTDLFDGSSTYAQQMMQEIYNNGPVVATMDVYEDFYHYASGVYSYTYGAFQGGHAVRIIGWGSLNGVNYWLADNSWGKNWGQQGLFMIRRGVNEVYIESEISYGAVKVV